MNKMNCELCGKNRARMYCESDQANLCWDCDSKVHSANFLVAKHSRNLLCHSCQSPTPWSACGPKLSPTLSVCNSCLETSCQVKNGERVEENYQTETDNDNDDDDDDDEEEEEESDSDEDEDEDDGNQVVPLSSSSSPLPARSVSSSGSYGGDGGAMEAVCSSPWKRPRESDCLHSEDEETCSSSLNCHNLLEDNKETSSSIGFLRPRKMLRTNEFCE
ncbi:zinc finger protein CONSTANS-like [Lycium ferocissimum]|uniref:zinc finger protein CONSTANS-like n=1 Tax=Lycium ferocissimum TaxID=112874 RepID=UPI0028164F03|nr:zinc finger protein CONSTANS-like [Lycium ferocissimum]